MLPDPTLRLSSARARGEGYRHEARPPRRGRAPVRAWHHARPAAGLKPPRPAPVHPPHRVPGTPLPGRPPEGWAPDEQVGYDDILAGLLGSACAIRDALEASRCDLAVARLRVETLRALAAAHAARLDDGPFEIDNDEHAEARRHRVGAPRADRGRLPLRLRRPRRVRAPRRGRGDVRRPLRRRLSAVRHRRPAASRDARRPRRVASRAVAAARHRDRAPGRAQRPRPARGPGEQREGTPDARRGDGRRPRRHRAPPAGCPGARAGEARARAGPGALASVFPSLRHLPLPSQMARDRGDSPRALCEPVAELALPLVPAPDPVTVAATLNAAFPWAREVTEQ